MGVLVALVGFGFLVAAIWKWKTASFGVISYPDSLRLVIPAVTCMTLGIQTVFSSFFLSILELNRNSTESLRPIPEMTPPGTAH